MTTTSAEEQKFEWRYRENTDSEFAEVAFGGLSILAQDCDGDFSHWHVKRGTAYLAAGEISFSIKPYHFDVAMERGVEVAAAILTAEFYNSMRDCRCHKSSIDCPECYGVGIVYSEVAGSNLTAARKAIADLKSASDEDAP